MDRLSGENLCYGDCQKVLAERDSLREENTRLQGELAALRENLAKINMPRMGWWHHDDIRCYHFAYRRGDCQNDAGTWRPLYEGDAE